MKASLSKKTKFIFITGGVLSSLGKGLSAASIGTLLESRGLTVTFQKLDPYINVDPGTMNPFQHGEVYVTNDGAETDLDMGHYERFTNAVMGKQNNYTSGRIYYSVIMKERRGEYLGGTVQVIPHITDEIKEAMVQLDGSADVAIIEIGGTVGDIEGLPFHRGHPPAAHRSGPGIHPVHPPDPGALYQDRRRGQDQADPAFGQGAAGLGHPARHPDVPDRSAAH